MYLEDNENTNWLQQVRLGNKNFDRSLTVTLRGSTCGVYFLENRLVGAVGDKEFADIIKNYFRLPITTATGKTIEKEGSLLHIESKVTLNPGDDQYVDSVSLDLLQNELGMVVE